MIAQRDVCTRKSKLKAIIRRNLTEVMLVQLVVLLLCLDLLL